MTKSTNSPLIIIPTYNERDNIVRLLQEIHELRIQSDILVIDDNSPDGTGPLVESLKKKYANLQLLSRPEKNGIGSAHLSGFEYAYARGYRRVLTMDCDFTHPPIYIPDFLREIENADIVLADRFERTDSIADWPFLRRVMTNLAHLLTRLLLGMSFDATGAYRCYNLDTLNRRIFYQIESKSYSFFFESLYRFWRSGARIREIPVHLPIRTQGSSKMTRADVLRSLQMLVKMTKIRLKTDFKTLINRGSASDI